MPTISMNPTVFYSENLPHVFDLYSPWSGSARQAVRDVIVKTDAWTSGTLRMLCAGRLVSSDQISQYLFSQIMQWLLDGATNPNMAADYNALVQAATAVGIGPRNRTNIGAAKGRAMSRGAVVNGVVALSVDRGPGNPIALPAPPAGAVAQHMATSLAAAAALGVQPPASAVAAAAKLGISPTGQPMTVTTPAPMETETVSEIAQAETQPETNDVLGDARRWLAPSVLAQLEAQIDTAIKEAFARGQATAAPRVETVAAGGVAERLPDSTLGKVFGIKGPRAKQPVQAWKSPADRVPTANPHYVFDADRLAVATRALDAAQSIWFGGPAGAGKTTLLREICARTGRAYFRLDLHRQIELSDLFGSRDIANGSTYFKPGALTEAVQVPGAVILLDEVASLKPGVLIGLQTQLDERQIKLHSENKVIDFAPGVCICAADNSLGSGDESGVYGDLHAMSVAFLDRFHKIVSVDYLSADLETDALQRATGAPDAFCWHVVAFANVVRASAKKGSLSHTLTLRRMIALAKDCLAGASPNDAFASTVEYFFPANDREAIRALWRANVVEATWRAALNPPAPGQAPVGQVATPRGAAAADAFEIVEG